MPKIMLNYWPNGRRRLGRPLKRLYDEAETGLSGPISWRLVTVQRSTTCPAWTPKLDASRCSETNVPACINGVILQETQSESWSVNLEQDSDTAWFICQSDLCKLSGSRPVWLLCHRLSPFFPAWIRWLSLLPMCQHIPVCSLNSPVFSLACQFAAAVYTILKQKSRYENRRCNAGSTSTGSCCSRPLNITLKSDTRVNVISCVLW
jgi:hypothetical protein